MQLEPKSAAFFHSNAGISALSSNDEMKHNPKAERKLSTPIADGRASKDVRRKRTGCLPLFCAKSC